LPSKDVCPPPSFARFAAEQCQQPPPDQQDRLHGNDDQVFDMFHVLIIESLRGLRNGDL
jgi:hypothetical protein